MLLSSIWEKVSNDSCCLKNNLSPEKKTIFTKIINEPYYFEKESKITCKEVKALLLYKLKQFYVFQDKAFEIKSDLSNHKKHLLSHFLEDLDIRNPLIRLGEDKYWDDCGKKVPLKGNIDIAYALNKGQYGICTENVWSELKVGKNVITILSDFRIITRLKKIFKDSILVIYVASAVDTAKLEKIQIARLGIDQSKEDSIKKKVNRLNSSINIKKWGNVAKVIHELNEDWEKTKPDADSTRFRAERIKTFHTRYIDNITLFDYVILNYNEGHPEDMTVQFNNIFKANNKNLLNKSPLFVVTAASNAGKGTMMEMLNLIGSDWSPTYDLLNVLNVFLPELLQTPNPRDPYNSEAAKLYNQCQIKYAEKVREYIVQYASSLEDLIPKEEEFKKDFPRYGFLGSDNDDDIHII